MEVLSSIASTLSMGLKPATVTDLSVEAGRPGSDDDTLSAASSMPSSESSVTLGNNGTAADPAYQSLVNSDVTTTATATITNGGTKKMAWRRTKPKHYGRTSLPSPMPSRQNYSVWSILKQCIGKELSKITMPIVFNEPLSFLQRLAEYMEFSYLLRKANNTDDPVLRIELITAFAVSALASNSERLAKPFNPLLGETYELEREGYRLVGEQVSHHPPISAFHAEGPDFMFHGSIYPKLKFWGKSLEAQPKGVITVYLRRYNEAYTWQNVNCCVHNIIVGKLWMEQYGTMDITNHTNGLRVSLQFKPAGWFGKELHRLEGFVYDKSKRKIRFLYGKWTDLLKSTDIPSYEDYQRQSGKLSVTSSAKASSRDATPERNKERQSPVSPLRSKPRSPRSPGGGGLAKMASLAGSVFSSSTARESAGGNDSGDEEDFNYSSTFSRQCTIDVMSAQDEEDDSPRYDSTYSIDIPNSRLLWECEPRPDNSEMYYNFTLFALSLNEMVGDPTKLPPTDCRFRPDIRLLEEGKLDEAGTEKERLEEKQRDSRKSRKKSSILGNKEKDSWSPKWFKQAINQHTKDVDWVFDEKYWDRNYDQLPDIF